MHYEWKLLYDAVDSQSKPDYTAVEIDTFLNQGIRLFIKDRFNLDANAKTGFEMSSDTIAALAPLHIESPILQTALSPTLIGDNYGVDLVDLDYDPWFVTKVAVNATKDSCPSKKIECRYRPIDHLNDRFSAPSFKWKRCPFRISANTNGTSVYLFTDGDFQLSSVEISYLKRPATVFIGGYNQIDSLYISTDDPVDSDLPEYYHDDIVELAVKLALRAQGDARINLFETDILSNKTKIN